MRLIRGRARVFVGFGGADVDRIDGRQSRIDGRSLERPSGGGGGVL